MKKLILVPMKRNDRAEDLLPYIEEVARPGMKVVFMVPYPVKGFCGSREEFGCKAIEEANALASYYDWETNQKKAEDFIAPAIKVLCANGIDAAAELYAGNTRRAVRDYAAKGNVHLIVTRAGVGQKIAGLLAGNNSLWALFKPPSFSPVLLIHPSVVA